MSRFYTEHGIKKGTAPGSLIFVGKQKMHKPHIRLIRYKDNEFEENEIPEVDDIFEHVESSYKHWINIDGVHDSSVIEKIGNHLKLDSLLLEDILDTSQRPKCESYDDHLYIVLRMIHYDEQHDVTISEQFSLILGSHYLITFQEIQGDILDSVRERLRKGKTMIRQRTMDYLAYALIDTIVDQYIFAIEKFGDKIEVIDRQVLTNPKKEILERINFLKREINYLRKAIRPVRELIIQLEKSDFIKKGTIPFLKDLQDHVTHATEAIETYRELLSDQLNVYHTSMSNKLNDILRILTIYSVIFIPLTFLAGIYGMNFKYFPELEFRYAYPLFWGFLILISLTMIYYFKRKKWL